MRSIVHDIERESNIMFKTSEHVEFRLPPAGSSVREFAPRIRRMKIDAYFLARTQTLQEHILDGWA